MFVFILLTLHYAEGLRLAKFAVTIYLARKYFLIEQEVLHLQDPDAERG